MKLKRCSCGAERTYGKDRKCFDCRLDLDGSSGVLEKKLKSIFFITRKKK